MANQKDTPSTRAKLFQFASPCLRVGFHLVIGGQVSIPKLGGGQGLCGARLVGEGAVPWEDIVQPWFH